MREERTGPSGDPSMSTRVPGTCDDAFIRQRSTGDPEKGACITRCHRDLLELRFLSTSCSEMTNHLVRPAGARDPTARPDCNIRVVHPHLALRSILPLSTTLTRITPVLSAFRPSPRSVIMTIARLGAPGLPSVQQLRGKPSRSAANRTAQRRPACCGETLRSETKTAPG